MTTTENYYNDKYFDWQAPIGEFGGWANLTKFQPFIHNDFNVIDFGCGGGYLLKIFYAKKKLALKSTILPESKLSRMVFGLWNHRWTLTNNGPI